MQETTSIQDTASSSNELSFSGSGKEFFGIWIVNILLTICTLGIYSAWAKVRTTNYFYGNTKLKGSSFSYTANPIAILKGRILAFVVLMIYSLISQSSLELGVLLILVVFLCSPFLIVRSLDFRFQNTEYRGLRFGFTGKTGEAFKVFIGGYLLVVLSVGVLFPWWEKMRKKFYVENIRFGTSQFNCNPELNIFYKTAGIIIAIIAFYFVVVVLSIGFAGGELFIFLIYPMLGILAAFWFSKITNHVFASSSLESIRFKSDLKTSELIGLWIVNLILLAITLGLATPWVQVRNARYRISKTSVIGGDLDSFCSNEKNKVSSISEEIGEALDIDLSI